MYLIDTNIFLEILLDQQKADECQRLLSKVYEGKIFAYVSSFTLHSIEVILERNKLIEALEAFLLDVHKARGLKRFETSTIEELLALKISKIHKIDFDDAIQFYICRTYSLDIISFDKHFDGTGIKRLEPKDMT